MLYAQIGNHKSKGMDWPLEWEKCQDMHNYLQRMTWGYQLTIERRMLFSAIDPEYRCVLVKWETQTGQLEKKREVLLETSDPAQMEAALFMLINEVEAEYKAANQRVSWVP